MDEQVDIKDMAYQYAKFYHLTRRKVDFLSAVEKNMTVYNLAVAEVVWEALHIYDTEMK